MDKLRSLEAFAHVVEEGSFAAAARRTGQTRSGINKAVIALEDQLGVQLLNRTTRKVSVTPTGDAYYQRTKAILQDITAADHAVMDNDDEPRGTLRLNAPLSFGTMHLGKALSDFLVRFPELKLELSLSDRFIDPLEDGFDATLRIGTLDQTPSLVDHPITEMNRYLVASPDFVDREGPIVAPEQLKALPCLHYGSLGEGHDWRLRRGEEETSVRVNGVMCANNGETLREAAICGLGVSMLPTFIIGPDLQSGRLVRVLADYAPPSIHLMLLYPPGRHVSPKIKHLLAFLYDRFGNRPSWDLID